MKSANMHTIIIILTLISQTFALPVDIRFRHVNPEIYRVPIFGKRFLKTHHNICNTVVRLIHSVPNLLSKRGTEHVSLLALRTCEDPVFLSAHETSILAASVTGAVGYNVRRHSEDAPDACFGLD